MKNRLIFACVAAVLAVSMLFCACGRQEEKPELYVAREASSFNGFFVKDHKVQFECKLTVVNDSESDKVFYIKGDFSAESKAGLIKEDTLYAVDENMKKVSFSLKAGEKAELSVYFFGTHGEKDTMTSKLLPEFTIEEVLTLTLN